MHEAVPAITSYGVSPIVRVPDFQSWMIKRMQQILLRLVILLTLMQVPWMQVHMESSRLSCEQSKTQSLLLKPAAFPHRASEASDHHSQWTDLVETYQLRSI